MLRLRKMEEKDSSKIAQLEQEIFSDAWTKAGVEGTWRQSHAFIVAAEEEHELIGYCIVYYVLDEAEIARLAVAKNYRRVGAGRSIMDKTEQICREKGVERVLLEVRESNETARKFYLNYGFSEDGIRKNFYTEPVEDAVLMSKSIR